jgi:hypothetical protein
MINPRLRRCITHPHCIIKLWQAIRSDLSLGVSDRMVTACRLIHGHTVLSRTAHSGKWLVKNLRELRGGHARIAKCSCVCGGYACRQSHALACLFQFTLQFLMGSSRNNRNLSRYYLHGKKLIMDRFESVAASARGS